MVSEPILEPLLRRWRLGKVIKTIQTYDKPYLLDIGCGWEAKLLLTVEPYIIHGTGIDFKAPEINHPKITTQKCTLNKELPFANASFDIVTMLAVLEHLEHPLEILHEIKRILKPQGCLVGTVPSKLSKPVLDFLAYKLNIVSEDEIRDHKQYFNKADLEFIFKQAGFSNIEHNYFQLGMNNFFKAS